jgi:hypothetical protein
MNNKTLKGANAYFYSAAAILVLVALLKISSIQDSVRYFLLEDPVFAFLTNRQVISLSAILELGIAMLLLKDARLVFKLTALLGLSSVLISYRIGLWWIDPQAPCKCYGRATDWLHIQPETADLAMKCILGYFVIGSLLVLIIVFVKRQRPLR